MDFHLPEPCSRADRIVDSVQCSESNRLHIHQLFSSQTLPRVVVGSLPFEVVVGRFVDYDDTCLPLQIYLACSTAGQQLSPRLWLSSYLWEINSGYFRDRPETIIAD